MKLTPPEWKLMNAVWKGHPVTARGIADRLRGGDRLRRGRPPRADEASLDTAQNVESHRRDPFRRDESTKREMSCRASASLLRRSSRCGCEGRKHLIPGALNARAV